MSVTTTGADWRAELERRLTRLRSILDDAACDIGLVFGCDGHDQSFRYLTNFAPVLGDMWLVLAGEPLCILTFQWQIAEARARSGIDHWEAAFDPVPLVIDAVRETRPRRVGMVGLERMPAPAHAALSQAVAGSELVDVGPAAVALRHRKSALEIELLREAATLTDAMLDGARAQLRPGMTETELAAALSAIPLAAGGQCAFETCVVSGLEEPIPIRRPTGRRIEVGDSVMVDLGAAVEGYQGDATRTFVLGEPSRLQLEVWDVVRRAYEAALELARPGVPCCELERASRRIIERAGYAVAHRVGHGIGLATSYEWPSLDTERAPLEPGVTICIEPGIYSPGAGNMKLEDDLVITDDGCELLTRSDSTLAVAS